MHYMSDQRVDERMITVHYYYYGAEETHSLEWQR